MTTDLTTRIAELASLIETRLTEDETAATDATYERPSWRFDMNGVHQVGGLKIAEPHSWYLAQHIARNDPARTLRRVTATRELAAAILAEPHDWIPGDEFYSCSQAAEMNPVPEPPGEPGSGCSDPDRAGQPCDCGRDARVARLLGIIASEWETT